MYASDSMRRARMLPECSGAVAERKWLKGIKVRAAELRRSAPVQKRYGARTPRVFFRATLENSHGNASANAARERDGAGASARVRVGACGGGHAGRDWCRADRGYVSRLLAH